MVLSKGIFNKNHDNNRLALWHTTSMLHIDILLKKVTFIHMIQGKDRHLYDYYSV